MILNFGVEFCCSILLMLNPCGQARKLRLAGRLARGLGPASTLQLSVPASYVSQLDPYRTLGSLDFPQTNWCNPAAFEIYAEFPVSHGCDRHDSSMGILCMLEKDLDVRDSLFLRQIGRRFDSD